MIACPVSAGCLGWLFVPIYIVILQMCKCLPHSPTCLTTDVLRFSIDASKTASTKSDEIVRFPLNGV